MSAILDRSQEIDAEMTAFQRLVEFGEGSFSSGIAICNSPVDRDRIIAEIQELHLGIVVLVIPARTVDVYEYVRERIREPRTLFLINLEASISSQESDSHTLRSLNASRDLWPQFFRCPIILWLPEYAATALSQQARDYWRYISHRFYFAMSSDVAMPRSSDLYDCHYLNVITLPMDEKLARIQELESRLSSLGTAIEPSLQRHALTWWNELATLHQFMGNSNEAHRIRRDEELPVYIRLGDKLKQAETMGEIADILLQRGQIAEALRIRREEELPVYEQLGDVRSKAITMGQIADILQQRGQIDEALRIRQEEELPVYERLDDTRSKAVAMGKIADIFQQRGQTEEALRIVRDEVLPLFNKSGAVWNVARTWGRIADILQQRGETEEALRIRREEQLPVYERLGDMQSLIICRWKISLILLHLSTPEEKEEGRKHLLWALDESEKHQYDFTDRLRSQVKRLIGE